MSDGLRTGIEALALSLDRGDSIDRGIAADLRALLAEHPATPAEEVAEVAVEEREATIRRSLARLLVDEYGETPRDWCELGSVRRIARALSDEIATHDAALTAKAKAEERERIAAAIAGSVSPGFGMNHDGTEDSHAMAYVEGLKDAHDIAKEPR